MIYIHYGSDSFQKEKFVSIKNRFGLIKPLGGLWASPTNAACGWYDWCMCDGYKVEDNEYWESSFYFTFKENSNVFQLPSIPSVIPLSYLDYSIDFEGCLEMGYDAIELHLFDRDEYIEDLHWLLYGWDCDSILVLNPESIEIVDEEKMNKMIDDK